MIVEAAPAKINLALHVIGRRADGYHLLDSLVAFAEAGDVITLSDGTGFAVCGPFADDVPTGGDNLCLRALRLAGAEARVQLDKRLPVAAGIGGGSSDAAAVLRAARRMGQPVPPDLAALGADLPVCMAAPGPARMRGIGEQVTPLAGLPALHLVLVNPRQPLATPAVFAALKSRENAPLPPLPLAPDAGGLTEWLAGCRNDLQAPAISLAPVIAEVLAALEAQGARLARMSGSGATCFGLFPTAKAADAAAQALSVRDWWALATRTHPSPAQREGRRVQP
ncbi:4-(cytidine 5'-diphospho)-2-C-methyl-D-erythritol kinase [Paracoccus suum]|uniref:4-diphosphocytidyl-2-C-methyl-D-erythritol kinase n=1 Tax=Paracoccus suum TaxID=2259340 RepID=A0A344PI68_9RHOB|nr:4-(cytidine 5'-diphospho)-2-C-methyl-D-erythritol kinase [Paracoccus suum]AXC49073.1 4-(cytidine 5'-diphospho)-2-C-methyl-D-erythritol kinase [Paracoccus suum]